MKVQQRLPRRMRKNPVVRAMPRWTSEPESTEWFDTFNLDGEELIGFVAEPQLPKEEVKRAEKEQKAPAKKAEKDQKAPVKKAEKEQKAPVKKAEKEQKAPEKKAEKEQKASEKKGKEDSDNIDVVVKIDYGGPKPTEVFRVKKVKRGLVVLSEAFHALGISYGLYVHDCLVDKKLRLKKHKPGGWFPEREGHLKTVIERMQEIFFDAAGKPIVSQILIGGPDQMKDLLKTRLPRNIAQLVSSVSVIGAPSHKTISHRLPDMLIAMENRIKLFDKPSEIYPQ